MSTFRFKPHKRKANDGSVSDRNNGIRAEDAGIILEVYKRQYLKEHGPVDESAAVDLVCDLAHWCDRERVALDTDFEAVVRMARVSWEEER